MRARDITEGQPYAWRRDGGWLPEKVTVTRVADGNAHWANEHGEHGRRRLADILGPWPAHAEAERGADELTSALRALPAPGRGFDVVHTGYGGYADFGVIVHLSISQAAALLAAGGIRNMGDQ